MKRDKMKIEIDEIEAEAILLLHRVAVSNLGQTEREYDRRWEPITEGGFSYVVWLLLGRLQEALEEENE
jgi:hypothetical protein